MEIAKLEQRKNLWCKNKNKKQKKKSVFVQKSDLSKNLLEFLM